MIDGHHMVSMESLPKKLRNEITIDFQNSYNNYEFSKNKSYHKNSEKKTNE